MTKILLCIFLCCLLKSTTAYCCFSDPCDSPCSAPGATCCGWNSYPTNICSNNCGCSTCYSPCSRTTCVCETYEATPCKSDSSCDCIKAAVCFPEVVYPVMAVEMRPSYYRSGCCC